VIASHDPNVCGLASGHQAARAKGLLGKRTSSIPRPSNIMLLLAATRERSQCSTASVLFGVLLARSHLRVSGRSLLGCNGEERHGTMSARTHRFSDTRGECVTTTSLADSERRDDGHGHHHRSRSCSLIMWVPWDSQRTADNIQTTVGSTSHSPTMPLPPPSAPTRASSRV
jgi:hypothetical protein